MSPEVSEREGSVSSITTVSATTAIHVSAGEDRGHPPVLKSSSESLRQISLQLSGLVMGGEVTGMEVNCCLMIKTFCGETIQARQWCSYLVPDKDTEKKVMIINK